MVEGHFRVTAMAGRGYGTSTALPRTEGQPQPRASQFSLALATPGHSFLDKGPKSMTCERSNMYHQAGFLTIPRTHCAHSKLT